MNILYLSKLSGNPWAGPTYSVPAQIFAQSRLDNVFWLNLNHNKIDAWVTEAGIFHNLDTNSPDLESLPRPFNEPNIVVVEQMYDYPFSRLIMQIQTKKIPYVIVPRGELCQSAQKQKKIKKIIGNFFWFNKMINYASAIQYLSENEFYNSKKWGRKRHLVIPNGINIPEKKIKRFSKEKIVASFIGRLDVYHKGIDVLLKSVVVMKAFLRTYHFELRLYGPSWDNSYERIEKYIKINCIEDIVFLCGPVYDELKKNVYEETDVFVLTSRFEGLPMGLLEALSYGVPCFITPGTNLERIVRQHNAGWTANCDVESISSALERVIKDRDVWEEKSQNAYEVACDYSWDSIASKTHDEYKRILKM